MICLKFAIQKSFKNTIILAFYIRDIKGLGKREIGKSIFQFLLINLNLTEKLTIKNTLEG